MSTTKSSCCFNAGAPETAFLSNRISGLLRSSFALSQDEEGERELLELLAKYTRWSECSILRLPRGWERQVSKRIQELIIGDDHGFCTLIDKRDQQLFNCDTQAQVAWAYLDPRHPGSPSRLLVAWNHESLVEDEILLNNTVLLLQIATLVMPRVNAKIRSAITFDRHFKQLRDNQDAYRRRVIRQQREGDTNHRRIRRLARNWLDPRYEGDPKAFQRFVDDVFGGLFRESLANARLEQPIHGTLGSIDIVYRNRATKGFFHHLTTRHHVPCPYILVECKNYKDVPKNPELHQLLGRFAEGRGNFGMLVCREIRDEDRVRLLMRCREIARDRRGWIMALDVADLDALLDAKLLGEKHVSDLLDDHFRLLVF